MRTPIRFTGANRAMAVLGMRPANSDVVVGGGRLAVRLGWAFRLAAPLETVRSAAPDHDRVLGWGAHGWRGRWLVNGSSSGIVRIELEPRARGRVLAFPIRVHTLRVAVEDPDALVRALAG